MNYLPIIPDVKTEQSATKSIFETLKSITPKLKESHQEEAFDILFEDEHDFILGYN